MSKTLESAAEPKHHEKMLDEALDQSRSLRSIDNHKKTQEIRDIKLHAFIVRKENQASRATWMQVLIGVVALGLAVASLNNNDSPVIKMASSLTDAIIKVIK